MLQIPVIETTLVASCFKSQNLIFQRMFRFQIARIYNVLLLRFLEVVSSVVRVANPFMRIVYREVVRCQIA